MGACRRCSYREDSIASIQCDECADGLYLLTAQSQNLEFKLSSSYETVSLCVEDCQAFSYEYVNNPNTMTCEYCGAGCQLCSVQDGCLASNRAGHGSRINTGGEYPYSIAYFSDSAPSSSFQTVNKCYSSFCDECQNYDYTLNRAKAYQCDSCYQYLGISLFTASALSSQICEIYLST